MLIHSEGSATLATRAGHERLAREALVTGLIGAATIAIWFLVLDTIQGQPLSTPTLLGTTLLELSRGPIGLEQSALTAVLGYTIVHGIAFGLFGFVAVQLFAAAERHPAFVFALLLISIFFFSAFLTGAYLFATPVFEALSVPMVLIGNLLAALAMGGYLWRKHPLDLSQLM